MPISSELAGIRHLQSRSHVNSQGVWGASAQSSFPFFLPIRKALTKPLRDLLQRVSYSRGCAICYAESNSTISARSEWGQITDVSFFLGGGAGGREGRGGGGTDVGLSGKARHVCIFE